MNTLRNLIARDGTTSDSTSTLSPTMVKALIALLVIVLVGGLSLGALVILRSVRRKRMEKAILPQYNSQQVRQHRRLTVTATPYGRNSKVFVVDEKQALYDECQSPQSPVPEIRITFPDEDDKSGKRQSGRVVVVRISETGGLGLEPYEEECLPPYQSGEGDRFHSLDLERMGGLKEKGSEKQWS